MVVPAHRWNNTRDPCKVAMPGVDGDAQDLTDVDLAKGSPASGQLRGGPQQLCDRLQYTLAVKAPDVHNTKRRLQSRWKPYCTLQ